MVDKEPESFTWRLRNAAKPLKFANRLPRDKEFKWWYATLRFHFDKLDAETQGEVENVVVGMSGRRRSYLSLGLNLIRRGIKSAGKVWRRSLARTLYRFKSLVGCFGREPPQVVSNYGTWIVERKSCLTYLCNLLRPSAPRCNPKSILCMHTTAISGQL